MGYLPILLIYDLKLGALATIFTIVYLLVTIRFTPKIKDLISKIFYKDLQVLGRFLDTLLGVSTVKLLGIEKLRFWKWKNEYKRNLNIVLDSEHTELILVSIQRGIYYFSQLVIFWYGAYLTFLGQLSIGQYLAFITIFMIIINSLNSVSNLWINVIELSVSASRINDILVQEPETINVMDSSKLSEINKLEVRNVSFKYNWNNQNYILKDINLKTEKGQFIGIVGRNGTGKTTLAKLMVNLYPDYEGQILANQTEIRKIHNQNLRKKIFLFPQDIYIFDGTIKENIRYANPNASMDNVVEAAKSVDIHDFIKENYLGYNHKIGEFGSNLSGGQKLKIGFARLFLSDPEVIILDEASSNLDLETEKIIMSNIKQRFKDKIIISIAHRIHTLKKSDKIIVLDQGQIVEKGTHKKLISKEGLYYQFLKSYVDI